MAPVFYTTKSHLREPNPTTERHEICILSSQGLSTRGGSDPGKPAWPEHFLKLAALIINELSLFG